MTLDLPLPVTDDISDGAVEVIFGVLLTDDQYEAHRGVLEFCAGKLVRVRIGNLPAWQDDGGLTIGFTLLPTGACPAVTRVYATGALVSETVHMAGHVSTDRLSRRLSVDRHTAGAYTGGVAFRSPHRTTPGAVMTTPADPDRAPMTPEELEEMARIHRIRETATEMEERIRKTLRDTDPNLSVGPGNDTEPHPPLPPAPSPE